MTSTSIETVNLDNLIYDPACQRREGTDQRRVNRMIAAFNPEAVGTLIASRRDDGSLVILDGAHRAAAMRGVGVTKARALIHSGLTRADEALMFVQLNTFKAPSSISRFLARAVADDPVAVDISRMIGERGWRIHSSNQDGDVTCPDSLERIYVDGAGTKKQGAHPELLEWVLDVSKGAWGDEYSGTSSHILLGLAQFRGRFGTAIDTKRLVHALSFHRPETLIARAKVLRDAQGGTLPAALGKILSGIYNNKKRSNLLPEWVWVR